MSANAVSSPEGGFIEISILCALRELNDGLGVIEYNQKLDHSSDALTSLQLFSNLVIASP